jgi:putative sigma-54 modulation protein
MKTKITVQGLQTSTVIRDYVSRRLHVALSRTHNLIRAVAVRLADINGPRGGIDKACSVQLSLTGQAPVIVTATSASIEHAIDRAIHRAAQTLSRRRMKIRKHHGTDKRSSALALSFETSPQFS